MDTLSIVLPVALAIIMYFVYEVPCEEQLPIKEKKKEGMAASRFELALKGLNAKRVPVNNTLLPGQDKQSQVNTEASQEIKRGENSSINPSRPVGNLQESAYKRILHAPEQKQIPALKEKTVKSLPQDTPATDAPAAVGAFAATGASPDTSAPLATEYSGGAGKDSDRSGCTRSATASVPGKTKPSRNIIVINPWVLFEPTCTKTGGTCVDIDHCRSLDFRSQVPGCRYGRKVCCNAMRKGEIYLLKK